jgi:hypothetical protein
MLACGCGPRSEVDRIEEAGPITGPFAVSQYFSPSGHMGDGATVGHIVADIDEGCKERPSGARGDCYRFTYTPGSLLWAGVYWAYPANNWGSRPGRTMAAKFTRVRLEAAASPGDFSIQLIAGGIQDRTLPYSDQFRVGSLPQVVSTDWKQFEIDLSDQTFDTVIGAFAWVTAYPPDTDPSAVAPRVLYLDDLVWE